MAYFKKNRPYDGDDPPAVDEEIYDDGFDELTEEEPELTEEEQREWRQSRFRFAAGAGNLMSIIAGTLLILLLLTLIFSMVRFVITDMERNFSLFSTRF